MSPARGRIAALSSVGLAGSFGLLCGRELTMQGGSQECLRRICYFHAIWGKERKASVLKASRKSVPEK